MPAEWRPEPFVMLVEAEGHSHVTLEQALKKELKDDFEDDGIPETSLVVSQPDNFKQEFRIAIIGMPQLCGEMYRQQIASLDIITAEKTDGDGGVFAML